MDVGGDVAWCTKYSSTKVLLTEVLPTEVPLLAFADWPYCERMRRLIVLLVAAATAGCAFPHPPPPMSMAKFARPPVDRDRIGFSTGLGMLIDDDEETSVYAFPVEAGLGVTLGERYDLGFSVGNLLGTAEGNFALLTGDLRLGILHGLGVGYVATETEQSLLAQFTGGAVLQIGRRRAFFSGVKATRGVVVGSEVFRPTTFYTGTVGFLPSGRLKVVPELAIQRANWRESDDAQDPTTSWAIVIGVTVLLHYYAPGL